MPPASSRPGQAQGVGDQRRQEIATEALNEVYFQDSGRRAGGLEEVHLSLAWIMHARRPARDYERFVQHSEAQITSAAVTLMTRRLTRRATPLAQAKRAA